MTGEGGEGGEGEENCHMLITSPLNEGGRDKKTSTRHRTIYLKYHMGTLHGHGLPPDTGGAFGISFEHMWTGKLCLRFKYIQIYSILYCIHM